MLSPQQLECLKIFFLRTILLPYLRMLLRKHSQIVFNNNMIIYKLLKPTPGLILEPQEGFSGGIVYC